MTFGGAAFGEDAFGEPAMRQGQPAVQGAVAFSMAALVAADGLQVDAPFATFSGAGRLTATGMIARQGHVTFAGGFGLRARGSDLETRLLTRNDSMPVWTVELDLYRAR